MSDKRIIGAVGIGDKTFTAGMEEEFEAAAKAAKVDMDRLEAKGAIRGYGKSVEDAPTTVNRQIGKDGNRLDEEIVEETDAETGTTKKRTAKKRRSR